MEKKKEEEEKEVGREFKRQKENLVGFLVSSGQSLSYIFLLYSSNAHFGHRKRYKKKNSYHTELG